MYYYIPSFFHLTRRPGKSSFRRLWAIDWMVEQSHLCKIWGNNIPSTNYSRCKCPKVRLCLAYIRKRKNFMLPELPVWAGEGCQIKLGTSMEVQWIRSTCQGRGHGFSLWFWRIPPAVGQLNSWTAPAEPLYLEPVCHNKGRHHSEKSTHHN